MRRVRRVCVLVIDVEGPVGFGGRVELRVLEGRRGGGVPAIPIPDTANPGCSVTQLRFC